MGEPAGTAPEQQATDVLFVLPAYNEAEQIAWSCRTLVAWLGAHARWSWRVLVADNASTDTTLAIARNLAAESPNAVAALHLDEKGRGRALTQAFLAADARVVAYMDVDLSTDLSAIEPLVEPLLANEADVAIGSRLAPGARVRRGAWREFVSRGYNLLLRAAFAPGWGIADAQCGFKALRAEVAQELLPRVADTGWFWDTELLAKARAAGLRIREVPVAWREDPGSTVNVWTTAVDDVRGIIRVRRELR